MYQLLYSASRSQLTAVQSLADRACAIHSTAYNIGWQHRMTNVKPTTDMQGGSLGHMFLACTDGDKIQKLLEPSPCRHSDRVQDGQIAG